ncbi:MAG: hypothetical protein WBE58_17335 [Verrucomicrobiales bacterium]
MRFGNTAKQLRRGVIVGLVIGGVAYAFSAAMFVFYERLPLARLIPLTVIVVLPALVIGLAILPTLMFSIHFVGDRVEHRMLDKWILSKAPASEFISMQVPSGIFAAKLNFADGTKMRFFGAHLEILAALASELQLRTAKAQPDPALNP